MARVSLNDLEMYQNRNRRDWHKELIKKYGRDIAIKTIKKQIPKGYTLKSYMDELEAEIAKETQN